MSALDDIRSDRMKKIEILKEKGIDAYPAESYRTHDNSTFLSLFESLTSSSEAVTLAGRIMSLRDQGGIVFLDLFDGTSKVQVLVRKEDTGEEQFQLFVDAVSVSDFIECTGTAFVTKRGMNSLLSTSWRMLTKSLQQVPDEWFGLKDGDERFRKRYLDMILNEEVRDLVKKRSIFWNTARKFLLDRDFLEVETPVLETLTGGAEARPFITHHNALDMEVYLRVSAGELWQKKLMVAGIPKTFEIGRIFRNEGMSATHAQDYTQLEFYEAYSDLQKGKQVVIDLYRALAQETFGTLQFNLDGVSVDLGSDWQEYDFNELMEKKYGIDPRTVTEKEVYDLLKKEHISHDKNIGLGRGVDLLWKSIRKEISGPGFLEGVPVYLEPLAKKSSKDPRVVERFQVILNGSEVGKAFSELNDPIDQRERFVAQQGLRDAGDDEAQMADFEYVEALEYGMPPVFGFGVSERLFSFLLGKSIREAQLFPLMKPRTED